MKPALLVSLVVTLALLSHDARAQCPADATINTGHRGTGVNDPANDFAENTIESFLHAQTEGAQMVELDVVHSVDGVLMVIHDADVDRTTDGTGCVGDMTVAQLQQLDAGFGTAAEGTGLVIPTLDEVLAAVDVDVNIEIKFHDGSCSTTDVALTAMDVADAIAADVKARRIVVSSFEAEVLTAVKNEDASIHLGLLTLDPADADIAVDRGFDALNVLSLVVRDPAAIQTIHDRGLEVAVWTENDWFLLGDHLTSGVDMIITDDPDVLEMVRADWCARYQMEQDDGGGCSSTGGQGPLSALLLLLLLMAVGLSRARP